jgi:hypothetical protein
MHVMTKTSAVYLLCLVDVCDVSEHTRVDLWSITPPSEVSLLPESLVLLAAALHPFLVAFLNQLHHDSFRPCCAFPVCSLSALLLLLLAAAQCLRVPPVSVDTGRLSRMSCCCSWRCAVDDALLLHQSVSART